jgi:hypothetical protein
MSLFHDPLPPRRGAVPNPNSAFDQACEDSFWQLFYDCRYNVVICKDRIAAAARADKRSNTWLLISSGGAGAVGAIKLLSGIIYLGYFWELASGVSVWLALAALLGKAPQVMYTVFPSINVFQGLSVDVQHDTRKLRITGSISDIESAYQKTYDALAAELGKLGPDHMSYASERRQRLTKQLQETIEKEGLGRRR